MRRVGSPPSRLDTGHYPVLLRVKPHVLGSVDERRLRGNRLEGLETSERLGLASGRRRREPGGASPASRPARCGPYAVAAAKPASARGSTALPPAWWPLRVGRWLRRLR